MDRIETPKRYEWEGERDRFWYKAKWTVRWEGKDFRTDPKPMESGLGSVTRNTDHKSDTFNRWYGSVQLVDSRKITVVKSDPLLTKEAAMAWVEVVERMNR